MRREHIAGQKEQGWEPAQAQGKVAQPKHSVAASSSIKQVATMQHAWYTAGS